MVPMSPRNKPMESSSEKHSSGNDSSCSESSSSNNNHHHRRRKQHSSSPGGGEVPKNSEEYKLRREKNNQAVRKSRDKSKQKARQTLERVNQLRKENEMLESKIVLLNKELSFLKDLFLAHAGTVHGVPLTEGDLAGQSANTHAITNDHRYGLPDEEALVKKE